MHPTWMHVQLPPMWHPLPMLAPVLPGEQKSDILSILSLCRLGMAEISPLSQLHALSSLPPPSFSVAVPNQLPSASGICIKTLSAQEPRSPPSISLCKHGRHITGAFVNQA